MRALRVVPLRLECERHAHERMGKVGKQGRAARTGEIEVVKIAGIGRPRLARGLLKRRCSAWARRTHPPTRPRPMLGHHTDGGYCCASLARHRGNAPGSGHGS